LAHFVFLCCGSLFVFCFFGFGCFPFVPVIFVVF
jgi:hypothetical protein